MSHYPDIQRLMERCQQAIDDSVSAFMECDMLPEESYRLRDQRAGWIGQLHTMIQLTEEQAFENRKRGG